MPSSFKLSTAALLFFLQLPIPAPAADEARPFELREGDRVVFLGDSIMEREQNFGWIELMLTTQFPDSNITFRNLGWSADTPSGDSRAGLSMMQAGHEPADEGWNQLVKQLGDARPTVVFVGYGMANSFDGTNGLAKFKSDYNRLLDTIEKLSPGVRFVLLSPLRHQWLKPPFPNPAAHNRQLQAFGDAIQEIAKTRQARFISLFAAFKEQSVSDDQALRWTGNGIDVTSDGYQQVAAFIQKQLGLDMHPRSKDWLAEKAEPLRRAILRKNEWFFDRSRPENRVYIYGFRKGEQGKIAGEIPQFDALITGEENRIAKLRSLKSGQDVPEIPLHNGNLNAVHTDQPKPTFAIADGLQVELWAENPLLDKPVQMNFDPQGRLWVATSEVYPQIEPGQAATDKILVLEDTKGTGHADKSTVFADGLLIPTGVLPGDGGCYVAQGTELLFFKDTRGSGKADLRRTVLSGFGTEDVHHNLHTLRWGFDGRLYMNQSVYTRTDTETPGGVVRLEGGGVFRFDPRDQQLEILFKGWINPWGHQFDEFGQSFLTDGADATGISYGLPGASYTTAPKARRILGSITPGSNPKFCGLEIIRSRLFPDDWQGDMITCDYRAHRIVRFKVAEQGAGYAAKEMPDVLSSTADTFRPVDVKLGPDGALYVADWSNPIIQHGVVDFRDPRRDKEHGRIWRITVKDRPLLQKVDFTRLKNTALLDELLSPNGYDQDQARRVLIERGAAKMKADLAAWRKSHPDETARLQALWMNEALNAGEMDVTTRTEACALLDAKDGRVRAAAVRALSHGIENVPKATELLSPLIADTNPRVRLETVRALGRIQSAGAAELALTAMNQPMDAFLDYALWLSINELAGPWVAAVKSGEWKPEGRERQLDFALKALPPAPAGQVLALLGNNRNLPRETPSPRIEVIGAAGSPTELRQLLDQLVHGDFDEPTALRVFAALNDATRLRNARPAGDLSELGILLQSSRDQLRLAALRLAAEWKLPQLQPRLLQVASDANASPEERTAAFAGLRAIGGSATIGELRELSANSPLPAIRRAAVATLASLDFSDALPGICEALKDSDNAKDLEEFWRELLGTKGASEKLTAQLPALELTPEAARAGARIAREGNRSPELVQELLKIAGLPLSDQQLSPAELLSLAQEALAKGDAARGERVFRRPGLACMNCHAIGGAGGKVGPDLTSIGATAPSDYLAESLLYPDAKIKDGYHSTTITTKDDQEFIGIVVKETDNEIILRNAANHDISVVKSAISQRVIGGSLMPGGLMDPLSAQEQLDLIKFLSMLGRPGDYDAAKGGVARLWKIYCVSAKNPPPALPAILEADFSRSGWVTAYSTVNGNLSREICETAIPSLGESQGFFAATQFQSVKSGPTRLELTGDVKKVWLNGLQVQPGALLHVNVNAGVNTLILQLDASGLPDAVKLSSDDVSFLTN